MATASTGRSRLPLGRRDIEQDAGALVLLATAAGSGPDDDRLVPALGSLGWAPRKGGAPESWQVRRAAELTLGALHRLGAYPRERFEWGAVPTPEGVALARAALRAWA